MKIIDWEKKGNVVRFYLGLDDLDEWWGDDWNDRPYEHNAERVYEEYVSGYVDVAFPFDWVVMEPADDWTYGGNSPFSKEAFIKRAAPFLVVVSKKRLDEIDYWYDPLYSRCVGMDGDEVYKLYFGDDISFLSGTDKQWKILDTKFSETDDDEDYDYEVDLIDEILKDPLAYGDAVSEGLGRA